jgi:hypothetical protein
VRSPSSSFGGGTTLPRRVAGRSYTGGDLARRPWPQPATSESGRAPRPQPLLQCQCDSSPASIGGRASRPQPRPQEFVVGHCRRRRGGSSCCRHGRAQGRSTPAAAFWNVAICVYWCCNNVFGMLQLVVFMMQLFVLHVAIVANMLHPRSRHVASVPCEWFKIKSKYFLCCKH